VALGCCRAVQAGLLGAGIDVTDGELLMHPPSDIPEVSCRSRYLTSASVVPVTLRNGDSLRMHSVL